MVGMRKIKKEKLGEGRGSSIVLKVDPETKALWNLAVKHGNMSEWFRHQLIFHFRKHLTPQQRIVYNREAIQLLQLATQEKINAYKNVCRKIENENGMKMQRLKNEIDEILESMKEVQLLNGGNDEC